MDLKKIHNELRINTTAENMWQVLSMYGDVSQFHAGVLRSYKEKGSENIASLGSERICHIVDLGLKITLKERITEYEEGRYYKYEVYEWKNFPIQKMFFAFTIIHSNQDYTILELDIEYKAKPAFLTPFMAGKMKRLTPDILLGYKHYAETGVKKVPIKKLNKNYSTPEWVAA